MRRKGTRRQLLKQAAAVSAGAMSFPYFVPSSVLGKDGEVAPSNRLVMGCIGTGGKGQNNMGWFMGKKNVQVVAVCDVDAKHCDSARDGVNQQYGNKDCRTYKDFRDLLAKEKTDLITVGTPDHWHGLIAIAAVKAGNDVYCEKPLVNTIAEGKALRDAARKYKRVLQTGSQERSNEKVRFACELVRNGRIGKVHTVRINLPCDDNHHQEVLKRKGILEAQPVPEGLDYDSWLGPTPKVPYHEWRCHFYWRFILAYGGGEMTDRGAHVIDLVGLGLDTDNTGPVEIQAKGWRPENSIYDTFFKYNFECKYANGVRMIGQNDGKRGLKFEGDKGSIFINIHGGALEAEPASLLETKIADNEIQLGRAPESEHHQNFLDAVASRKPPFADLEIGHRSATICHLLNIAMVTGRPLKWDPVKEQITNDAEANKMIERPMRAPWHM